MGWGWHWSELGGKWEWKRGGRGKWERNLAYPKPDPVRTSSHPNIHQNTTKRRVRCKIRMFSCTLLSCLVLFACLTPPLINWTKVSEFCIVVSTTWHAFHSHTPCDICRFTFAITCLNFLLWPILEPETAWSPCFWHFQGGLCLIWRRTFFPKLQFK